MAKVIIFGVGQIAEIAHFYLTTDTDHEIAGFTVDKAYITGETYKELPVVDFEIVETIFPPSEYKMFIPISYRTMNKIRADHYYKAKEKGYGFISYISSKATYYDTPVGENCFIFEHNTIQPFSEIGNNVIIWSGNHIGHHTKIHDHCFITTHVVISGSVDVGEYSVIGVNSTIRDMVKIGKENMIGAGSLILHNTPDFAVYSEGDTPISKVPSNKLRYPKI